MPNINIFNKRTYARKDHPHSKAFYCGRRMRDIPGSPLANPFKIQGRIVTRKLVIKSYREYFSGVVNNTQYAQSEIDRDKFMQALADICIVYQSGQDVDLLCWCSPDSTGNSVPCHCDVIRDYVLKVTSL